MKLKMKLEKSAKDLPEFLKKWNVGFDIKETLGVTELNEKEYALEKLYSKL